MPETVNLKASDGHSFGAYVAEPKQPAKHAVVIIQEIFGVNGHIRGVADGYANDGYLAVAPALFDRAERGVELKYVPDDMKRGVGIATKIGLDSALKDVASTLEYVTKRVGAKHAGVVGFCWGGTLAWRAATQHHPAAAVCYYGGHIADTASDHPHCPVMMHFGGQDKHIGPEQIAKIRKAHPEMPVFVYDAGHGFNCEQRADYNPEAAKLARERTLEFLAAHLG